MMKKILLVNASVRPCSRTRELTEAVLQKLEGELQEVKLYEETICALDLKGMEIRDQAARMQDFSHPMFVHAKQFAAADIIVVAAPYWDLMFPAILKTYLENITVSGLTFRYSQQGRPVSMCRAEALYYVTTSGGFIGQNDFGYAYVKALATNFFGIKDVRCFVAEGLDIFGSNPDEILQKAKADIVLSGG